MHQSYRKFNHYTIGFYLIVLIVFCITAFIVPQVEAVRQINGWNNIVLDVLFAGITNLGDGLFLVLFSALLLFYRFYLSIALLINGILQAAVVSLFKRVLFPDALRPIAYLDPATVHFVEGVKVHRFMSFPSGHTLTIFGLCVFLSLCSRNRVVTILLLIIAVLVGLSRVYLLQHFVMDITVGATIGAGIGVFTYYYFENSNKPQWMMQRFEIKTRKSSARPGSIGQ